MEKPNILILNKTQIILVSILVVGLIICGYFLFRNNDYIKFLKKESNEYKTKNELLKNQIAVKDGTLVIYEHQFDSIQNIRNERYNPKKGGFKQINDQYEEDLHNIANDDAVASFRAISDIFRQHSSK